MSVKLLPNGTDAAFVCIELFSDHRARIGNFCRSLAAARRIGSTPADALTATGQPAFFPYICPFSPAQQ
jgi:hypothetical protein